MTSPPKDMLDKMEVALSRVRNVALEEVVQLIEARAFEDGEIDEPAKDIIAAIRALKTEEKE